MGRLVLRRKDQGDTVFAAVVRLSQRWQVEATGLKMSSFTKVTDDFWIAEVENYPQAARDFLLEEFEKRGIVLALFSKGAR